MEQSQAQNFQFASKSTTSFRCILFTLHCIQQSIYTFPFENKKQNLAQWKDLLFHTCNKIIWVQECGTFDLQCHVWRWHNIE
jgi:hypothetical protein